MKKFFQKLRKNKFGFSLVELIVVIAIMAVIAAVLVPSLLMHVEESRAEKDVKATDEVVTAVELALADQDVYDELVEHSVFDNVSCYVDKDSESGYERVVIKETYNGYAEQYMFDDDARQNDEVPYYGAGNMRGLTITFSPDKDSNESTYDLSRAIINRFVGRKTGYLYENEKLYNAIRAVVGDKIYNSSQTYRNSDFTIFIRLGSAGGNEAGNQDATQVWGQYNGTNLPADAVQTAKITTDRVIGDAGQYDSAVNEYINDESNTNIDFSQLAAMGNSNFGEELEKNKIPTEPGLYDENNVMLASWDELVNDYGLNVEANYYDPQYKNSGSMYAVLNKNPNLSTGTKVIISDSVTKIGTMAFYKCSSLTSVTMPNSVTKISNEIFRGCTRLTNVTISNSVTWIGWNVFDGCSSLTSITIPDSVTEIGNYTFSGCTRLQNVIIPDSVTKIGWNTFQNCTSLTSVAIPNSVKSIGSKAFMNCTSLTIQVPSATTVKANSFENCKEVIYY